MKYLQKICERTATDGHDTFTRETVHPFFGQPWTCRGCRRPAALGWLNHDVFYCTRCVVVGTEPPCPTVIYHKFGRKVWAGGGWTAVRDEAAVYPTVKAAQDELCQQSWPERAVAVWPLHEFDARLAELSAADFEE